MTCGQNNPLIFQFAITHGDFAGGGKAASEVKRTLSQIGCPPSIIRRAAIATYEGEMNMVIHSQGGTITIFISTDKVKIICEDVGPGIFDVDLAMQEGYSTASDEIRELGFGAGMGLPNMRRCSDNFIIDSVVGRGTKVEMTIDII